jgi:thiol-disulfide isomerase/thioredoxin
MLKIVLLFIVGVQCLLSFKSTGQEKKVVLINENPSWKECIISYWNTASTIPVTFPDMWNSGQIKKNSLIVEINTTEPIFINFAWNFKIQIVYLFPGDTLRFKSSGDDSNNFLFSGNRSKDELMFYSRLESTGLGFLTSGNQELEVTKNLNYAYVASKTKERYESRLQLLNNGNVFSKEGRNLIEKSLHFQYLSELLFPYQIWRPLKDIVKQANNVPQSYKHELLNFKDQFNRDTLFNLLDYKRFVLQYGRFQLIEDLEDDQIDFNTLIRYYETNFSGLKRDMLLFDEIMINFQMTGDLSSFQKVIKVLETKAMRDTLENILSRNKKDFTQEALNSVLETPEGQKLSLRNILEEKNNLLTYLDFWATWCAPCLMEMSHSRELSQEFKDSNVNFIYISIDKDKDKWLKKLPKLPTGPNIRHFRSLDDTKLLNSIGVQSVPRYMLTDWNMSMISSNAPRPGSREIRNLISLNIEKAK